MYNTKYRYNIVILKLFTNEYLFLRILFTKYLVNIKYVFMCIYYR